MKNKPTKKARVRPAYYLTHPHNRNVPGVGMPCELVLPCSSRKEANQRKKWANMSHQKRITEIMGVLALRNNKTDTAKDILALMGEPTP